jgi:hypothetical protein
MIAYASRTGTRRNLAGLREAGWRLLVSATGVLRAEGFAYALDNGAWTSYQRGAPFDSDAFALALDRLGAGADWIALPDIVAGGRASLDLSLSWAERVGAVNGRTLLPVQDGMAPDEIRPLLSDGRGIFLGGSTGWKLGTMCAWGRIAREVGCHYHIARVNTARRIRLCQDAGADSFDGTSASRFRTTLAGLDNARRQELLFARGTRA